MIYTLTDIQKASKVFRLNLINSITGIKPGNLIGTTNKQGNTNLAIISSVVHLGSAPPLIGFILRPHHEVRRDTYENILETGQYTINHIPEKHVQQAHYTSVKFDQNVSEFDKCQFTPQYISGFSAPFVQESVIKFGLKFIEELPIKHNNTKMIIGEIQQVITPENVVSSNGRVNLETAKSVGIGGLNRYYKLTQIAEFPYAREAELPPF